MEHSQQYYHQMQQQHQQQHQQQQQQQQQHPHQQQHHPSDMGPGLAHMQPMDNHRHMQTIGADINPRQPEYEGAATGPESVFHNAGRGLEGENKRKLAEYWQNTITDIEQREHDFKSHSLPLARIKKVMKADEDVKMISAEAPILFAKGCDIFITELTMRAWIHADENKRRTLQRSDIANAISRSDMFDFLIDIVPREEFVATRAEGAANNNDSNEMPVAGAAGGFIGMPLGHPATHQTGGHQPIQQHIQRPIAMEEPHPTPGPYYPPSLQHGGHGPDPSQAQHGHNSRMYNPPPQHPGAYDARYGMPPPPQPQTMNAMGGHQPRYDQYAYQNPYAHQGMHPDMSVGHPQQHPHQYNPMMHANGGAGAAGAQHDLYRQQQQQQQQQQHHHGVSHHDPYAQLPPPPPKNLVGQHGGPDGDLQHEHNGYGR